MNIRSGTKTAGIFKDLTIVRNQGIASLARFGYGTADRSGQSSTRRVLSQARRAGLVKKNIKNGSFSLTAKGLKVARSLA